MATGSSGARIGKISVLGIGVLITLAALVALGLPAGPTKNNTTSSGASSGPMSSNSSLNSSGPLAIAVTTTTLDRIPADAPANFTTFIFDVTITNLDSVTHPSNEFYFTLIGSGNAVYKLAVGYGVRQPFPTLDILPGQHASGQIAFQLPNADQPSKLEYKISLESIDEFVTYLPQPSRWVLEVGPAQATLQGPSASGYVSSASIGNRTYFYYSTDKIIVNITLQAFFTNEAAIRVTSITVSNQGFSIVSITPALPVDVQSAGKTRISVVLTLPQTSLRIQPLAFTVITS